MTENECSICLNPLNGGTTTVGCCRNSFHTTCYVQWMQKKLECPMCRAPQESLGLPGKVVQDSVMACRVGGVLWVVGTSIIVLTFYYRSLSDVPPT
jgi:hypothetical protein